MINRHYLFLLFLGSSIFSQIFADTTNTAAQNPSTTPLPDHIAFCIADMKFLERGEIKVLEFGEGPRSKFKGHEKLYGPQVLWKKFWDYLQTFNVPLWGIRMNDVEHQEDMAPDYFFSMGGTATTGISDLKNQIKELLRNEDGVIKTQSCRDYKAIAMIRYGRPYRSIEKFKKIFPQVCFLGDISNKYVNSKYNTNMLFDDAFSAYFRPKCMSCSKEYTPTLAHEITNDIGGSFFVIKPVNSCRGRGVIIVERDNLDNMLQQILLRPQELADFGIDHTYGYWAFDTNDKFLVEEFVESKPVSVDVDGNGNMQEFDGTMRLVFTIHHYQNQPPVINYLGGYWKLPAKSLSDEPADFIEKHKSDMKPNDHLSSAVIAPQDMIDAQETLSFLLVHLFKKMMEREEADNYLNRDLGECISH